MPGWNSPAAVRRVAQAANPGFTRRQWALGGSWFFIGASIFGLVWIALSGGQGRVFGLESAGVDHTVWGLTYAGWLGTALLWTQIVAVITATVMTLLPVRRFRRLGHAVLIGWASWWTLGTLYLASISPVGFGLQGLLMTCLLGCTIARAWMSRDAGHAPASSGADPAKSFPAPPSSHADASDAGASRSSATAVPGWRDRLNRASETTTNAVRDSAHAVWHRGLPAARKATVSVWQRLRQGFSDETRAATRATVDPRIRA